MLMAIRASKIQSCVRRLSAQSYRELWESKHFLKEPLKKTKAYVYQAVKIPTSNFFPDHCCIGAYLPRLFHPLSYHSEFSLLFL